MIELRLHGAMTIDALVDASGLSKTATRAHLLRMERDGAVTRVTIEAEGPGRPPVAFGLTDHGASMFPSFDEALLSRLLRFLEENAMEALIAAFFEELWSERMSELLCVLGQDHLEVMGLDERLVAIKASLTGEHFMPVIDRETLADGSEVVTIRECNCPFPAAARASKLPCQFEIDFLSQALGARPRALSIASSRKDTCVFEFVIGPTPSEG